MKILALSNGKNPPIFLSLSGLFVALILNIAPQMIEPAAQYSSAHSAAGRGCGMSAALPEPTVRDRFLTARQDEWHGLGAPLVGRASALREF